MSCWNIAEAIHQMAASNIAEDPALLHGAQVISFKELDRRAVAIARYLAALDLPVGSHIGHYMRNSNAYMEAFVGTGFAGHAHVNVNYRYRDEELISLCNSLDIRVLVYDHEFADRVASIREQLHETVAFIEVGDQPCCTFAQSLNALYEQASGNIGEPFLCFV